MAKTKRIGILTAGGDSPGLNAAIRGVGKTALGYYGMEIIGFRDGFRGIVEDHKLKLDKSKLAGILIEGRPQAGWAVLGIGLNVAVRLEELPQELRRTAATLGCSPDAIEPTLARLLAALARRLDQPSAEILDA